MDQGSFLVVGPLLHWIGGSICSYHLSITLICWCETTFTLVAERGAPANGELQCSGNTDLFLF